MTAEADPAVSITATCNPCGGQFSMTDRRSRVHAALRVWDAEHRHIGAPSQETARSEWVRHAH